MPPKKGGGNASSKKANNANKKSKKGDDGIDEDFEALMAQAEMEAKEHLEKNPKAVPKGSGAKQLPVSLAADEKPVPSSSEHPENPYPPASADTLPRQTWPEPTIPIRQLYSTQPRQFPTGVVTEHPGTSNAYRIENQELKEKERYGLEDQLQDLRESAEVHRQVRRWVQSWIKPGISLMLMCDRIEKKIEELIGKDGFKRGQGFPTGCSLNHVAAHYTPNTGDEKVVLQYDDVMKVDFGTQVNGRIIDSAWTVSFNERYDPLLQAVKEATYEGVKQAGIDVRLGDIGAAIQEVMESYEVELNGKVLPVKSIRNLTGHSIGSFQIHAGKSVPIVRGGEQTKMEEGELFAIETFGSTGKGVVTEEGDCSHYMVNPEMQNANVRLDTARKLLTHINRTYSTLPFCRKWLDRQGYDRHLMSLNHLVEQGVVNKYPPLADIKGCYTAQFEHTLILRPTCKEILSKGEDY